MSWIRIDDNCTQHPKFVRAGGQAGWLWLAGQGYCARLRTDGRIPKAAAHILQPGGTRLAAVLVREGIWHDQGDHYEVHDYLEFQPSRAQLEERDRQRTARVRAWRERKGVAHGDATVTPSHAQPKRVPRRDCNAPPEPEPEPQEPKNTPSRAARARGVRDERFERFWAAYPRRKGKDAARKAWAKRKPDDDLVMVMLSSIEAQQASDQWQRGFIPYPATWLNEGRWQDDVDPVQPAQTMTEKYSRDYDADPEAELALKEAREGRPERWNAIKTRVVSAAKGMP